MACKVSDIEEGGFDALFVEEPPEFLLCVVCHLALRKPVHIIDCGHRFCNTCFQKMKQNSNERGIDLLCPLDREVIDTSKVFPDKGIERLVFELKVKCDNEGKGCEWKGDLRSLESHLNLDCDYELVSCAHDGCNIKVERKELEEHMSNCSKRIILAADNWKLIQILSQRLDVCEQVISEKYEEQLKLLNVSQVELKEQLGETRKQLKEIKEELNETKAQLQTKETESIEIKTLFKEVKEELNETKEQLKEVKEELNETNEQLITKDKNLKKHQHNVSLRFEKFMSTNVDFETELEELSEKLNEIIDTFVNKSNIDYLSKIIGEEVKQVKCGDWSIWECIVPSCGNSLNSASYLTNDGYHFIIKFRYNGYYCLQLHVFRDELNLKRGNPDKKISYEIGDFKDSTEVNMIDKQNNYFDKSLWISTNLSLLIKINDIQPYVINKRIKLPFMIE